MGIGINGCIIPGEVNVYATTSQLGIHFSEGPHLIGTHQNMADSGQVLKIFEVVKLVLKPAPTGSFGKVMGFIHNDGQRLALDQGCLHSFPSFSCWYPSDFPIDKWVL